MNKTFTLTFSVKKAKTLSNGLAPINLRITIDGKPTEITTKRHVDPEHWCCKSQKVLGKSPEVKSLNAYLKTLEQEVYEAHHALLKDKEHVTIDTLKARLLGTDEQRRMLIPIFKNHNSQVKALVGEQFAARTYIRYETSLKHTIAFLQWKFGVKDIDITKINHAFIADYDFYLRSVKKCNNNTTIKYLKNFGKVVRICLANGWIDRNPFLNYKAKVKEVDRVFLNQTEIDAISNKEFTIERLSLVKDIFLFSCYTGLAYIDILNLTSNNISIGIDGEKWIFTHRQKTDSATNIPLLPMAQAIVDKYKGTPQVQCTGRLLPMLTNQKMNSYLKEIADVCGINKELTFHCARHTFATTVTLSNGVPIETVSKLLGHRNIKQTQHYAKILDQKVSNDMQALKAKLAAPSKVIDMAQTGS